jgi:hypothetical protein
VKINGRDYTHHRCVITYAEIVNITGEREPSVTYRFRSTGAGGILHRGDRIAVAEDLVIDAITTGNA